MNRVASHPFSVCFVLALASLSASPGLGQGTLTPPPGPPAPTMKTLDQVEARIILNPVNTPGDAANTYIISTPGSYYLTGNITGSPGKHGISVLADNVTLDLNGFALIGGGGATRGVNTTTPIGNFSIRNGSIRGWTDGGVRAEAAVTLAEKLLLADNVGGTGLAVGNGSLVRDCVARGNGIGFHCADRTQISHCSATVNTAVGFKCENHVTLIDSTSAGNGGAAITAGESSSVIRCNASRSASGITVGPGCMVVDCTVSYGGFIGIHAGAGSTVRGCTLLDNGYFAVVATDNCQIVGNTCIVNSTSSFSGGGIQAFGNGSRIEGNSCRTGSGFGVLVGPGVKNLVIRNSVHGNATGASFAIVAGNRFGAIVDLTANNPNTAGGNSAPSTVGTTDPWANFSY